MKRLLFIYNPQSGKARMRARLGEVVERLAAQDYEITIHPTKRSRDATETVLAIGEQFDHIVCGGGDGTLNEVVDGLLHLKRPPTLGYIPAGTTNDFSKNLFLPPDMLDAADCAVSGVPRACDMGSFNGRTFVYVAAFGIFTSVSYDTPQEYKNALGHLAYVLEGANELWELRPYHMKVTWETGETEGDFIYGMASNTVSVGGFKGVNPEAVKLDDGLFEVMLVKMPRNLTELHSIVRALLKRMPDGNVLGFHASRITFAGEGAIPWTLDGEFGGNQERAEVQNLQKAVTIYEGK